MATTPSVTDDTGLLRTRDAAAFLDYSERQVRRLVAAGVLNAVRVTPNAHPRFRLRDLVALAETKEGDDTCR